MFDQDKMKRWDKYVQDKPELKEILGQLAVGIMELKARVESLERMEFGK